MFAALVSKSELLKPGPGSPWGVRNCSLGATCRGQARATSRGQN